MFLVLLGQVYFALLISGGKNEINDLRLFLAPRVGIYYYKSPSRENAFIFKAYNGSDSSDKQSSFYSRASRWSANAD